VFLAHHKLAVKYIHEVRLDEGEFYLFRHINDRFEAIFFSKNEKERLKIEIDFRDYVDYLWL
jgi:hypothetical protein